MKKLNKKGFTLVELMVTLVVLALIFVLATTIVLRHLNKAKTEGFVSRVKQYVKALDTDALERKLYDEYVEYSFPKDKIPYVDKQPDSGYAIKSEANKFRIAIWDETLKKCAVKDYSGKDVEIDPDLNTESKCLDKYIAISGKNVLDKKVVDLTGFDAKDENGQDAVLKASCYTLDQQDYIDNFDVENCGPSLFVPEEINNRKVKGFTYNFSGNLSGRGLKEVYISDVSDFEFIPSGFLAAGSYDFSNFNKIVIMKLDKLQQINGGFLYGIYNLSDVILRDLPNLTNISSGNFYYSTSKYGEIGNVELVNLPKLSSFSALFAYIKYNNLTIKNVGAANCKVSSSSFANAIGENATVIIENNPNLDFNFQSLSYPLAGGGSTYKKISIKNNPSLTSLGYSIFANAGYSDGIVEIENNDNLASISTGAFSNGTGIGTLKKVSVKNNKNLTTMDSGFFGSGQYTYSGGKIILENNPKLTSLTNSDFCLNGTLDEISIKNNASLSSISNGAFNVCGPSATINTINIKDNENFTTIENGAFYALTVNNFILENLPSMENLSRYGSMGSMTIDKLDFSKTNITTVDTSSSIYSCTINKMVLPKTLTNFTPAHLVSGVTGEVYTGGSDKCYLYDKFVTRDESGNVVGYLCNPNILPDCN